MSTRHDFSVVKLDLCIRALLLDHILALKKKYAYASRASCYPICRMYMLGIIGRVSRETTNVVHY